MSSDPSFLRKPAPARRRVGEWIALVVLGLLLAVQLFLAQRAQLSADARWRPLVQAICDVAGCSVPAWREPGAFAMLAQGLRLHDSGHLAQMLGHQRKQVVQRHQACQHPAGRDHRKATDALAPHGGEHVLDRLILQRLPLRAQVALNRTAAVVFTALAARLALSQR